MSVQLPRPIEQSYGPYIIDLAGWWLVIGDVHLPFHDMTTIRLAVKTAKKNGVKGIVLNGDILDCHALSRFDREPTAHRFRYEIQLGRQLLSWLRQEFPDAVIVWKDGNHDLRITRYLMSRAQELFDLDVLTLPNLLHFDQNRIDWVTDDRVIRAGKLNIIHGHEYRPAIQAPVNPARGAFLRAKANILVGHWHQASHHAESTIEGAQQGAWSVGCACYLSPRYMRLNKWVHGFAMIHIDADGYFEVRNLKIINGIIA